MPWVCRVLTDAQDAIPELTGVFRAKDAQCGFRGEWESRNGPEVRREGHL